MFGQQYTRVELCELIQEDIANAPPGLANMPYGIQIYMRSMYYRLFVNGIGEDAKEQYPLDTVEVNDTEDLHELSFTASLIRSFRTTMLYERFGLSIKDWLEMPKHLADEIRNDSRMESAQEADRITALEREQKKQG